MLIHQNEYPFSCKICKKGFRRKDKLMDHTSRVHKEYYAVLKQQEQFETMNDLNLTRNRNNNGHSDKDRSLLISHK